MRLLPLGAIILGLLSAPSGFAEEYVAYSLKVARERIQSVPEGREFRNLHRDTFQLGGITEVRGLVVDQENGDIILVGKRTEARSCLTLDDFVVALRARLLYDQWPLVSIDPMSNAATTEMQQVRFEGNVADTIFGQDMFNADYRLKEICMGLEKPGVPGLKTYWDWAVEETKRREEVAHNDVVSRFWFYPSNPGTAVGKGVCIIRGLKLAVFTQVLAAKIDGKPVKDLNSFRDKMSDAFARDVSNQFDDLCYAQPSFNRLRGLQELVAISKALQELDRQPDLTWWLEKYQVQKAETPKETKLLRRRYTGTKGGLELSGGVCLTALLALRLKAGDVQALRDAVLTTRPNHNHLIWTFLADKWIIALTPGQSNKHDIVPLFLQALFLSEQKRYDEAVKLFDLILTLDPRCGDAWSDRGLAHRLLGNLGAAEQDYRHALEISPYPAFACNNLAILLMRKGDLAEAEKTFRRAVKVAPFLPPVHNNLAICLRQKGDLNGAAKEYQVAIALNHDDHDPYHNLGLCLLLDGKVHDAASALQQAVKLRPESKDSYFWFAVALFEDGQNDQSRDVFQEYLKLANHLEEIKEPRFTRYGYATVVSSFLSDDTAGKELGVDVKPATAREYLRLIEAQRR